MFALVTDAATKNWALSALRHGHQITAPGGIVRLQLVANRGAAFGIGSGHETVVALVSLALIIALGVWAVRASTAAERIGAWLAVGGGLGNLLDRVVRPPGGLHGAVTDWIHVSFYGPTFNLADLWLRGGLLIARHRMAVELAEEARRAGGLTNETDDDYERTSLMQVGIHFMNFTHPGGGAGCGRRSATRRSRPTRRGSHCLHRDGPLVPDGALRGPPTTRCSRATRC